MSEKPSIKLGNNLAGTLAWCETLGSVLDSTESRLSALERQPIQSKAPDSTGTGEGGWIDENTKVWILWPSGNVGNCSLFYVWASPIHPVAIMPYIPGQPKPEGPVK